MIFEYRNKLYPTYIREGNAMHAIEPLALHFCQGNGLDLGAGKWPLPGATPVELKDGGDVMQVEGQWDYVFSSHCLEHLADPIRALETWLGVLKTNGTLFLYLPHPDMEYWQPQNCRKHLHTWRPIQMAMILEDLGLTDVIYSERDLMWSFAVVGRKSGVCE